ncbi:hypothetical protein, conserved [Eimeria maxima]|uniref:Uncharacterized protein n=1 Tax=Eimeria maxima TaxID=5804 RepID=U6MEB5_EIMMA|nr:hypothetical protein, conserved [Eimeria maxima]CDJ60799.1 hypothetical protein, conserved [Eimeria maxima]
MQRLQCTDPFEEDVRKLGFDPPPKPTTTSSSSSNSNSNSSRSNSSSSSSNKNKCLMHSGLNTATAAAGGPGGAATIAEVAEAASKACGPPEVPASMQQQQQQHLVRQQMLQQLQQNLDHDEPPVDAIISLCNKDRLERQLIPCFREIRAAMRLLLHGEGAERAMLGEALVLSLTSAVSIIDNELAAYHRYVRDLETALARWKDREIELQQLLQHQQQLQQIVASHQRLRDEDKKHYEEIIKNLHDRIDELQQEIARLEPEDELVAETRDRHGELLQLLQGRAAEHAVQGELLQQGRLLLQQITTGVLPMESLRDKERGRVYETKEGELCFRYQQQQQQQQQEQRATPAAAAAAAEALTVDDSSSSNKCGTMNSSSSHSSSTITSSNSSSSSSSSSCLLLCCRPYDVKERGGPPPGLSLEEIVAVAAAAYKAKAASDAAAAAAAAAPGQQQKQIRLSLVETLEDILTLSRPTQKEVQHTLASITYTLLLLQRDQEQQQQQLQQQLQQQPQQQQHQQQQQQQQNDSPEFFTLRRAVRFGR